jgi:hypothetical protein
MSIEPLESVILPAPAPGAAGTAAESYAETAHRLQSEAPARLLEEPCRAA